MMYLTEIIARRSHEDWMRTVALMNVIRASHQLKDDARQFHRNCLTECSLKVITYRISMQESLLTSSREKILYR